MISIGVVFEMPIVEQPFEMPSPSRAAAVAAARDHVHHVGAVLLRVEAADAEVAAGARRRAEQLVGDRLAERREHRLGDALAHLGGAARDRPRIVRVEERAFGLDDVQRLERAGVDRRLPERRA